MLENTIVANLELGATNSATPALDALATSADKAAAGIESSFGRLSAVTDPIEAQFRALGASIEGLGGSVSKASAAFSDIASSGQKSMSLLSASFESVSGQLETFGGKLSAISKAQADLVTSARDTSASLIGLGGDVEALGGHLSSLSEEALAAKMGLSDVSEEAGYTASALAKATGEVSSFGGKLSSLEGSLSAIDGALSGLADKISGLSGPSSAAADGFKSMMDGGSGLPDLLKGIDGAASPLSESLKAAAAQTDPLASGLLAIRTNSDGMATVMTDLGGAIGTTGDRAGTAAPEVAAYAKAINDLKDAQNRPATPLTPVAVGGGGAGSAAENTAKNDARSAESKGGFIPAIGGTAHETRSTASELSHTASTAALGDLIMSAYGLHDYMQFQAGQQRLVSTHEATQGQANQIGQWILKNMGPLGVSAPEMEQGFYQALARHLTIPQAEQSIKYAAMGQVSDAGAANAPLPDLENTIAVLVKDYGVTPKVAANLAMGGVTNSTASFGTFAKALARPSSVAPLIGANIPDVLGMVAELTQHGFTPQHAGLIGMSTERAFLEPNGTQLGIAQALEGGNFQKGTQLFNVQAHGGFVNTLENILHVAETSHPTLKSLEGEGLTAKEAQAKLKMTYDPAEIIGHLLGNSAALQGVEAIAGSPRDRKDLQKTIRNITASGKHDLIGQGFQTGSQTDAFKLKQSEEEINKFAIVVGKDLTPGFIKFTSGLSKAADALTAFAQKHPTITSDAVTGLLGLGAAGLVAKPAMFLGRTANLLSGGLLGKGAGLIPDALGGMGILSGEEGAAGLAALGPVGWAILAGAGVGIGGYEALTHRKQVGQALGVAGSHLGAGLGIAGTEIGQGLGVAGDWAGQHKGDILLAALTGPLGLALAHRQQVSQVAGQAGNAIGAGLGFVGHNGGNFLGATGHMLGTMPLFQDLGAEAQKAEVAVKAVLDKIKSDIGQTFSNLGGSGFVQFFAQWENEAKSAGNAITNAITQPFEAAGATIGNALGAIGSTIGNTFNAIGSQIHQTTGQWGNDIGGTLGSWGSAVGAWLAPMQSALQTTFTGIGGALHQTLDGLGGAFSTAWSGIASATEKTLQPLATFLGSWAKGIEQQLQADFTADANLVEGAWNAVSTTTSRTLSAIGSAIGSQLGAWGSVIGHEMGQIGNLVGQGWQDASSATVKALSALSSTVSSDWTAISAAIAHVLGQIGNAIGSQLASWAGDIHAGLATVQGYFSSAWTAISSAVGSFLGKIGSTIGSQLAAWGGDVSSALGQIGNTFGQWFHATEMAFAAFGTDWDHANGTMFGNWLAGVGKGLGSITASIGTWFGSELAAFGKFGGDVISSLVKGVESDAGKLKDALSTVVKDAMDAAKTEVGNLAGGLWSGLTSGLSNLLHIGGGGGNLASLFGVNGTFSGLGQNLSPTVANADQQGLRAMGSTSPFSGDYDFAAPLGSKVVLPGAMTYLGNDQALGEWGNLEYWATPDGGVIGLPHLADLPKLQKGKTYKAGSYIGEVGNPYGTTAPSGSTAYWTGSHLAVIADQKAASYLGGGNVKLPSNLTGYSSAIMAAARATGLPPAIIASVIQQESSGIASSSSQGADGTDVGLMQYGPTEAKLVGGQYTYNPNQNIMTGAKYLAYLLKGPAKGNLDVALQMYNGGPGNVGSAATTRYANTVLSRAQGYGAVGGGGGRPVVTEGYGAGTGQGYGVNLFSDGSAFPGGPPRAGQLVMPPLPFTAPSISGVPDQSIAHATGYLGNYSSAVSSYGPGLSQYLQPSIAAYQKQINQAKQQYITAANKYEQSTYAPAVNAENLRHAQADAGINQTYQGTVGAANQRQQATIATANQLYQQTASKLEQTYKETIDKRATANQEAVRHYLAGQGIAVISSHESAALSAKNRTSTLQGELKNLNETWGRQKSGIEQEIAKYAGSKTKTGKSEEATAIDRLHTATASHNQQVSKITGEMSKVSSGLAEKLGVADSKRKAQMDEWLRHNETVLKGNDASTYQHYKDAVSQADQKRKTAIDKANTNRQSAIDKANTNRQKALQKEDGANGTHATKMAAIQKSNESALDKLRSSLDKTVSGIDKAMKSAMDPGKMWSALSTAIGNSLSKHEAQSNVAFLQGGINQQAINKAAADQLAQQRMSLAQSQTSMGTDLLTGNIANLSSDFGNLAGVIQNTVIAGYIQGKGAIDQWTSGLVEAANGEELVQQVQAGFAAVVDSARTNLSAMSSDVQTLQGATLRQWDDALVHGTGNVQQLSAKLVQEAQASDAITHASNLQNVVIGEMTHDASALSSGLQGLATEANNAMTFFTDMVGRGGDAGQNFDTLTTNALQAADNLGSFNDVLSGVNSVLSGVQNEALTEFMRNGSIAAGTLSDYNAAGQQVNTLTADQIETNIKLAKSSQDVTQYQTALAAETAFLQGKMQSAAALYGTSSTQYKQAQAAFQQVSNESSGLSAWLQNLANGTAMTAQQQTDAQTALADFKNQGVGPSDTAMQQYTGTVNATNDAQSQLNDALKTADTDVTNLGTAALSTASQLASVTSDLTSLATSIGKVITAQEMQLGASPLQGAAGKLPSPSSILAPTPLPPGTHTITVANGQIYTSSSGPAGLVAPGGYGYNAYQQSGENAGNAWGAGLVNSQMGQSAWQALNAVKYHLKFSSPNEAGDDPTLWGLKLAASFAQGLTNGVSVVQQAAQALLSPVQQAALSFEQGSGSISNVLAALPLGTSVGGNMTWRNGPQGLGVYTAYGQFVSSMPSTIPGTGIETDNQSWTGPTTPTFGETSGVVGPRNQGVTIINGTGGYQTYMGPGGAIMAGGKVIPLTYNGQLNMAGVIPYGVDQQYALAHPMSIQSNANLQPSNLIEDWVRQSMGLPSGSGSWENVGGWMVRQAFSTGGDTSNNPLMQAALAPLLNYTQGVVSRSQGLTSDQAQQLVSAAQQTASNTSTSVSNQAQQLSQFQTLLAWIKGEFVAAKVDATRIGKSLSFEDFLDGLSGIAATAMAASSLA